jgi:hypothetical protein
MNPNVEPVPPPIISQAPHIKPPAPPEAAAPAMLKTVSRRGPVVNLGIPSWVLASAVTGTVCLLGGWLVMTSRTEVRRDPSAATTAGQTLANKDNLPIRAAQSSGATSDVRRGDNPFESSPSPRPVAPAEVTEEKPMSTAVKPAAQGVQAPSANEAIAALPWNSFTSLDRTYTVSAPGVGKFEFKSSPDALEWTENASWLFDNGKVGVSQVSYSDDAVLTSAETQLRDVAERTEQVVAPGVIFQVQSTRHISMSGYSGREWTCVMRGTDHDRFHVRNRLVVTPRRNYTLIALATTPDDLDDLTHRFMDSFKLSRPELVHEEQRHLAFRRSLEAGIDNSGDYASAPNGTSDAGGGFCRACSGTGQCATCSGGVNPASCSYCYGEGTVATSGTLMSTCTWCNGRRVRCFTCGGSGRCRVCRGGAMSFGGTTGGNSEAERQSAARQQTEDLIPQMESMGLSGDAMHRTLFGN